MRAVNALLLPGDSCLLLLSHLLHVGSEAVCGDCSVAAEHVALGQHGLQVHAWLHDDTGVACSTCTVPASCLCDACKRQ